MFGLWVRLGFRVRGLRVNAYPDVNAGYALYLSIYLYIYMYLYIYIYLCVCVCAFIFIFIHRKASLVGTVLARGESDAERKV